MKALKKQGGRDQVEPGVWEFPPQPGYRSLYGVIGGLINFRELRVLDIDWTRGYGGDEGKARTQRLLDLFKAGERWVNPEVLK